MIRRNIQGQGIRKFLHSQLVTPDEIYHFKNQFAPIKVSNKMRYFLLANMFLCIFKNWLNKQKIVCISR